MDFGHVELEVDSHARVCNGSIQTEGPRCGRCSLSCYPSEAGVQAYLTSLESSSVFQLPLTFATGCLRRLPEPFLEGLTAPPSGNAGGRWLRLGDRSESALFGEGGLSQLKKLTPAVQGGRG